MSTRRLALAACALVLAVAGAGGAPDGPPEEQVSAVARDPVTGDTWIGTLGGGIVRDSAGRLDRFTQFNSGLAGDEVLAVQLWRGRVFVATTRGISAYDPRTDAWTLDLERRADAPPTVIVSLAASEASLYGASSDGRLFRHDDRLDAWLLAEEPVARTAFDSARSGQVPIESPWPAARTRRAPEQTLAIGILIPMSKPISVAGASRSWPDERPDQTAIEDLLARRNARGGIEIELSRSAFLYERQGWGTPEDTLSILALRPEVVGVVGHRVAAASAEAVLAARLRLPVVDAAPADPAPPAETRDPWVFRCGRYGTEAQAAVMDALLRDARRRPRLAILRTPGAETARRLDFWSARAAARGAPVALDLAWNPETDDLGPVVARIRRARVQAVLTWADAGTSLRLLRALRERGMEAEFVGGPRIVEDEFARLAPTAPGGVVAVAPCRHTAPDEVIGSDSLRDRSVDAAAHLLTAVETAGRDREAVRDALRRVQARSVARLEGGVWRIETRAD